MIGDPLRRLFGRRRRALPEDTEEVLHRHIAWWPRLSDDERAEVLAHLPDLFARTSWEAANGFTLTDSMKVVISALAAIMQVGYRPGAPLPGEHLPGEHLPGEHLSGDPDSDSPRPDKPLSGLGTVIVLPTARVLTGSRHAGVNGISTDAAIAVDGQTHPNGPLVLAWDSVRSEARHPERGRNVVVHELAHRLDMDDRLTDGTPVFPSPADRVRWVDTLTPVFLAVQNGSPDVIGPYAGLNPGEFFAVVSELFFCRPSLLAEHHREVFTVFADYYRVDPRRWEASPGSGAENPRGEV